MPHVGFERKGVGPTRQRIAGRDSPTHVFRFFPISVSDTDQTVAEKDRAGPRLRRWQLKVGGKPEMDAAGLGTV